MKPYSLYTQILNLLKSKLTVAVSETYPKTSEKLPLQESIMTVELTCGSENKTIVLLTSYIAEKDGAKECRDLTEQARNIIENAFIPNKKSFTSKDVFYDKSKDAFCQKSEILFEIESGQEEAIEIKFGDEVISSSKKTKLDLKRKVTTYHSPISGNITQDLGVGLKSITGTAYVDSNQYLRLISFINSGEVKTIKIDKTNFQGKLSSISGIPNGKIEFKFIEIV